MSEHQCVIVGASHAAAELVVRLRREGWDHGICVISNEYHLPYHRPPLSKEFLSGDKNAEQLLIRPPSAYDKAEVNFVLGTKVSSIDRERQRVLLEGGDPIQYKKLVLTTGAHVRKLEIPGADLPGVLYLRTLGDVNGIRKFIDQSKKVVIIGGGYIGLETAAVMNKLGLRVTLIEAMDRILKRVATEHISAFYTRVHQEEGIEIVTSTATSRIEGNTQVEKVVCENGQEFEADLVIVGIGVTPAVELAEQAGLKTDNGILVDEFARTSDPNILAAGDCTRHHNGIYDRYVRLESVQNAVDQARVAAATICGTLKPYKSLPWFWSDQYDIKLQIAGLSEGYDQVVVRGDSSAGRSFSVCYLQEGRLLSLAAINRPQDFMMGKRLILDRLEVDQAMLKDDTLSLKELLA